ncbi:MAG: ABC transporter permease [Actinomycetota bacterium]
MRDRRRLGGLVLHQLRYENKAFWRNPPSVFFTFAFPLIFLALFNAFFGNQVINYFGHRTRTSTLFIPTIAAFSIINATFTNLAISLTFARERGLLKRTRGTPLPAWIYLSVRILHAGAVGVALVVIVAVAGALAYDVDLPRHTLPALVLTLAVGGLTFASLGIATTAVVSNADASPAVVNGIILPLLFISGIFFRVDQAPQWLGRVADLFPVRHLAQAMQHAFNPFETGSGLRGGDLRVMALWGLAGVVVAVRFFSWEPRR